MYLKSYKIKVPIESLSCSQSKFYLQGNMCTLIGETNETWNFKRRKTGTYSKNPVTHLRWVFLQK